MTRQPPNRSDTIDLAEAFYSQYGEDIVALKAMGRVRGPRYFVEVGVIDGVRLSNTLALERRGWRGLLVEAHPGFVGLVRANRPGSTVVHAAAADVTGRTMPFHADPRGDLSSLVPRDDAEMRRRFGRWFRGYEVVEVPVRTLDDMLEEANAPAGMEVVSIDIEGGELAALRGFDLGRWRPRMLILEADDADALAALSAHLRPRGYRLARRIGVNALFTRGWLDRWRVRLAKVDQPVVHTANPMDRDAHDALVMPAAFETRGAYARRLAGTLRRAA